MIEAHQQMPEQVHYFGSDGSYSQIMAKRLFPDGSSVEHIAQPTFEDTIEALALNPRAVAVTPIENNSSGRVHDHSDVLLERNLIVDGAYWLKIPLHLLGANFSSEASAKKIISHIQAIKQASVYRKVTGLEYQRYPSTSEAARIVASENDSALVCLGGLTLAKESGLQILREHVANKGINNKTKFYVVRARQGNEIPQIPEPNGEDLMVTMVVGLKDRKGSLGHYLVELAENGANLRTLVSSPDPEDDGSHEDEGDHLFWLDFQAHSASVNGILNIAKNKSHTLDLLGIYKPGQTYPSE